MMDFSDLKSSLLKEAEQKASEIVANAENEASAMLKEAEKRKKEIVASYEEKAQNDALKLERERLAWAELEKRRIISLGRERFIQRVLDELRKELKNFRKTKEYRDFLKSNVKSVLAEMGRGAVVHVVKGDGALLKGICKRVKEDLNALGGFIAEDEKKGVRAVFTFDELIVKKEDELRREIVRSWG